MTHYNIINIRDKGGELSGQKVYNGAITVTSLPGFLTDFGALKTATENLVLGELASEVLVMDNTVLSNALPASNFAQREIKLLIRYRGNTNGKNYQLEIPTPDLAALTFTAGSGDFVDITAGTVMPAWVTAFETIARAPDDDTENVTVDSAQVVGRNI